MSSTIQVINPTNKQNNQVVVGNNTLRFMDSQSKLDDEGKSIIIDEAMKILSHCVKPGTNDSITNIAVGYVQSGKTLSFTTLTALAADNGYRMIIYLTGTKTNLEKQTSDRLASDLDTDSSDVYNLMSGIDYNFTLDTSIKNFLIHTDDVILIPILKHYKHIQRLADTFASPTLKSFLNNLGVIIIDDEADQSSFNTFAKKNTANPDWIEDDFSKTYASILALKKSLPNHSYIQYTATPQAAFLIDNSDILSPTYHTVLTPGKGYTGGKFFFKNKNYQLVHLVDDTEVYHHKRNPLTTIPKSLIDSLQQFLVSVAIVVFIQKRKNVDFLSMMIHVDGRCDTNTLFANWTKNALQQWIDILTLDEKDPGRKLVCKKFKNAYDEMTHYIQNPPSFDEVMKNMVKVILRTKIHLVQSQGGSVGDDGISWKSAKANILIGADMLNRGFTIEKLSMTYMTRTTQGKSNADTIEQRCRFFGYKMDYADICRIYLSKKSLVEYNDYVEHEETLRANLSQCETLEEFSKHSHAMLLAETLNPTRTNILSSKLVRNKLSGWKQMPSLDCIDNNKVLFESFLSNIPSTAYTDCENYGNNPIRNHRWVNIPINDFIDFFKLVKYEDAPNITRKIVTIQYLYYLRNSLNIDHIRLYEMAYKATMQSGDIRTRGIKDDKPNNLQAGRAANGSYPGDIKFYTDNEVCVQVHHIKIEQPLHRLNSKDLYNLCIYYPENLATSFVGLDSDDEDDQD